MSEKERLDRLDEAIIEEILGLSASEAAELVSKDDAMACSERKGWSESYAWPVQRRMSRSTSPVPRRPAAG
jgi:hypothetical protein